MPIEPHRIEAAARALMSDWGSIDAPSSRELEYAIDYAERILTAGFPELAAGTAWVAPAKPDMAMLEASLIAMVGEIDARYPALPEDKPDNAFMRGLIVGAGSGRNSEEMRVAYEAARDAHLSKGKDDDHG